jgi:hypothetical protein
MRTASLVLVQVLRDIVLGCDYREEGGDEEVGADGAGDEVFDQRGGLRGEGGEFEELLELCAFVEEAVDEL